jgi:hypothetical protein
MLRNIFAIFAMLAFLRGTDVSRYGGSLSH